jgi:hypothetical protein
MHSQLSFAALDNGAAKFRQRDDASGFDLPRWCAYCALQEDLDNGF